MNKKHIITISIVALLLVGLSIATLILTARNRNISLVFREEEASVKMHVTNKLDIGWQDRSIEDLAAVDINTIGLGQCSLPADDDGVPLVVSEQPDRASAEIEEVYNADDVLLHTITDSYHGGKKYLTLYTGYEADGSSVVNGYTAYVYEGDWLDKDITFNSSYENLSCRVYEYDTSGRITKTTYYNGYRDRSFDTHTWSVIDSGWEEVVEYDTIEEYAWGDDYLGILKTINTYEEGKLIATTKYKKSSETGEIILASDRKYTYDKDRLVKVEKFYPGFGGRYLVWYKDYRYSVFGHLLEARQYRGDGSLLGYSLYTSLHADPVSNWQ